MLLRILQGVGQFPPQGLSSSEGQLWRLTNPELGLFDEDIVVFGRLIVVFANPFLPVSSDT